MNDRLRDKLTILNTIGNLFILIVLLSAGSLIWASDSNGVWHRAEDVVGGVFGEDEASQEFEFANKVDVTGSLCINGECYDSWDNVCDSWIENSVINE
jgi:hypothetical protein